MVTLLMCLFIVLFAMSQVDKAKFAALASGLSHSFGDADLPSTPRHDARSESVLDGLPDPVNIAAGVGETRPRRHQPEAGRRRRRPGRRCSARSTSQAEAKHAYDELAAARAADRRRR